MFVKFLADGGTMAVGRKTASYAWGSWDVTIPEGEKQVETDKRNSSGYLYKMQRPDGSAPGLFDRQFVRADAMMDMNSNTSTVETMLDSAENKVKGNIFFERDIEGAGLGHYVAGEDYNLYDTVGVVIWGKTLNLPITSITKQTNKDNRIAHTVHVGGSLIQDAQALKIKNNEIRKAILQERKETSKALAVVDKKAGDAQTSANNAQSSADKAQSSADNALSAANVAQQTADENFAEILSQKAMMDEWNSRAWEAEQENKRTQLAASKAQESADAAQLTANDAKRLGETAHVGVSDIKRIFEQMETGLKGTNLQGSITEQLVRMAEIGNGSQAWINANQAAWNALQIDFNNKVIEWQQAQEAIQEQFEQQQEEINANQDALLSELKDQQIRMEKNWTASGFIREGLIQDRVIVYDGKMITLFKVHGESKTDSTYPGGQIGIGTPILGAGFNISTFIQVIYKDNSTKTYLRNFSSGDVIRVPTDEDFFYVNGTAANPIIGAMFYFKLTSATEKNIKLSSISRRASSGWSTIPEYTFTASAGSNYIIDYKVQWLNATSAKTYGIRVLVNGSPVLSTTSSSLGPLLFSGKATQRLQKTIAISKNDKVEFQVYTDSSILIAERRNYQASGEYQYIAMS